MSPSCTFLPTSPVRGHHDGLLAGLDGHGHDLGLGHGQCGVKLLLGVKLHGTRVAKDLSGQAAKFFFFSHVSLSQGSKQGRSG